MMKTIIVVAVALMLTGCSYLGSTTIYVDAQGVEHETDGRTAHTMAERDLAIERERTIQIAFSKADTAGGAVAAAVLSVIPSQRLTPHKSTSEELLPWAHILNPWAMALAGIGGGNGGGASANGNGAALSLNRSNNNTFLVTTKPDLNASSYSPSLNSSNPFYFALAGEEGQASSLGSNTRDQSTDTRSGDAALVTP